MSKLVDLPTKPADEEEAGERLSSYLESWSSGLTERADGPAAEAAIAGLYKNIGLAHPRIVWVESPLVGALAYQSIGTGYRTLTSPYARGDVGTGARRDFHGLRDPFGFPIYAESAAPARVRRHASSPQAAAIERTRDTARRINATLRAEVLRRIPQVVIEHASVDPAPVPIDGQLGELLIGSSAEAFSRLVGREVFSAVAGLAVRHAFIEQLMDGRTSSTAQAMQPAQFDSDTLHWAALESVLGVPFYSPRNGSTVHRKRLQLRLQLAMAAGPWWALDGLALVSERPLTVSVDADGRLHAERGPALAFGDGFTIHAWHGVAVDREVIEAPETITVAAIDREHNAERRRVLVERFGHDRLVREGKGTLRHEDETGRLWALSMGLLDGWRRDEPVVMVEVLNSTPEPDGSRRAYFLRVPPTMRTAKDAVAWTFTMNGSEYAPRVQT